MWGQGVNIPPRKFERRLLSQRKIQGATDYREWVDSPWKIL